MSDSLAASVASANAALNEIAGLPRDAEGVVFNSPWEAKAFAIVVLLHQGGHFEWREWAGVLGSVIAESPEVPYYEQWLRAAERLITERGIVAGEVLAAARDEIRAAQAEPHDHSH